ncbi:MAG: hypothetical protein F3744_11685 [Nitrospinae bacterium]|nr:hypothetical protein [Nitrospinota bacterium]
MALRRVATSRGGKGQHFSIPPHPNLLPPGEKEQTTPSPLRGEGWGEGEGEGPHPIRIGKTGMQM